MFVFSTECIIWSLVYRELNIALLLPPFAQALIKGRRGDAGRQQQENAYRKSGILYPNGTMFQA